MSPTSPTSRHNHMQESIFLSSQPNNPQEPPFSSTPPTPINGVVHVLSLIMKNALSFTIKVKLNTLFHNTKDTKTHCNTLCNLEHPQNPTPIQTKNKCTGYYQQICEANNIQSYRQDVLLYL